MSILANLKSDASIKNETDNVGSSFSVVDSGLYEGVITQAYIQNADSGAMALNVTLKTEAGNEINQSLWMTSGTAKGGNNYYVDKDGQKQYLPGYLMANSLCLLTAGKEISDMDTENKVIQLYSSTAKAKVPTKVNMLMDLLNQPIVFGVIKQTVDKTVKNDAGVYVPTGETREENELDKFFRASDRKTTAEIRAQAEEAAFAAIWEAKWQGKVRNKAKGAGTGNGTAGAPNTAAATTKPKTSLFA